MPRGEGRIRRHIRVAREVRNEPRRIGALIREWLLNIWRARGGGFYGLGYLTAFVVLEIQMFIGDIGDSEGVVEFVTGQAVEYLLRFTVLSFVNVVLALLWPIYFLQWLGVWGFVFLGGGYLAFERALRPFVESWFPELRPAQMNSESPS